MDFLNIYSSNLIKNDDGIWINLNNPVKNRQDHIFYPSDGNKVLKGIEDNSFWFHHRNHVISSLVSSFSSSNKVFVEIGAGNGFVSKSLQQNGFTVIAVEPDMAGAQNCLDKKLNYVICSHFDDIQFKENSIENAGLFDVLEHISDPVHFLNKIRITMKKDSLLYITVPSYKFLYSSWDKQSGHFRRYTIKTLKKRTPVSRFFC